jgi:hypothetical protein
MEAAEFLNVQDPVPYESHGQRPIGTGGWKLNGVFQRQGGSPLGCAQALFSGDTSDIVLLKDQRGPDRWFNSCS